MIHDRTATMPATFFIGVKFEIGNNNIVLAFVG